MQIEFVNYAYNSFCCLFFFFFCLSPILLTYLHVLSLSSDELKFENARMVLFLSVTTRK